jgi:signal transduction histidine kinase
MSQEIIQANYEQALNEYDQARQDADKEIQQLRIRVKNNELSRVDYNSLLPGISQKVEPFRAKYEQALKMYREAGLDLENVLGLE